MLPDLVTLNWLAFGSIAINLTCIGVLVRTIYKTRRARDTYRRLARDLPGTLAAMMAAQDRLAEANARLDAATAGWEELVAERRAIEARATGPDAAVRVFLVKPPTDKEDGWNAL